MPELTRRYVVMAMATEAPFDLTDLDGVFVLKPWKDPAALRALRTYCENCYPELARELEAWIRAVETGPVVRGGIGRRNEAHLKPAVQARATRKRAEARPRPHARAHRKPTKRRPPRNGKKRRG